MLNAKSKDIFKGILEGILEGNLETTKNFPKENISIDIFLW